MDGQVIPIPYSKLPILTSVIPYSKPVLKQQVGGVFLQIGQRLKELYGNFCSNHPRAAHVITSNRYTPPYLLGPSYLADKHNMSWVSLPGCVRVVATHFVTTALQIPISYPLYNRPPTALRWKHTISML